MHYILLVEFSLSHVPTPPICMTLYLSIDNIQLVQVQDLELWEEYEFLLSQDNKRLDFLEYRLGAEISNQWIVSRQEIFKFIK